MLKELKIKCPQCNSLLGMKVKPEKGVNFWYAYCPACDYHWIQGKTKQFQFV